MLRRARDLVRRHPLRAYDAVHLASALEPKAALEEPVTFVCALYDIGEAELPSVGHDVAQAFRPAAERVQFLVMEYLEGETLAARLGRAGPTKVGPYEFETEAALTIEERVRREVIAAAKRRR